MTTRVAIDRLSRGFAGGALGALANSLVVWACGALGVTAAAGVKIAPALTPAWLYPRIVWGGLWGLLLVVPVFKRSAVVRGVVLSLLPTAATLLIFFPLKGKGLLGQQLGVLTPVFPLIFNAIWGAVAGWWYGCGEERSARETA